MPTALHLHLSLKDRITAHYSAQPLIDARILADRSAPAYLSRHLLSFDIAYLYIAKCNEIGASKVELKTPFARGHIDSFELL